jgi:hypothetical protein
MDSVDLIVMDILSLIDVKRPFVCLIGTSVYPFRAEHHHRAVHEVIHNIFKLNRVILKINAVEVNFFICYDLKLIMPAF